MATSNNTVGFAAQARRRHPNGLPGSNLTALRILLSGAPSVTASRTHNVSSEYLNWTPPRLEVRQSPSRGYGLFAVDTIPAYSRILEDFALLSMALGEDLPQLWPKYQLLPAEDKRIFDALSAPPYQLNKEEKLSSQLQQREYSNSDADSMARVSSRFLGNSFKTEAERWKYALYPTVARINHSCTPNSHCHYRETTGAEYVYALRTIQAGEEIEITYFDMTLPLADRQARTIAWSFTCRCPACSQQLGPDYERHLAIVRGSKNSANEVPGFIDRSKDLTEHTPRAISIAESDELPWLRAALPELYMRHAGALMANGSASDRRRGDRKAADAMNEGMKWKERILGSDNPQVVFARARKIEERRAAAGLG